MGMVITLSMVVTKIASEASIQRVSSFTYCMAKADIMDAQGNAEYITMTLNIMSFTGSKSMRQKIKMGESIFREMTIMSALGLRNISVNFCFPSIIPARIIPRGEAEEPSEDIALSSGAGKHKPVKYKNRPITMAMTGGEKNSLTDA